VTADHLRWTARPELHRPIVLAAFEGWNDAGDAATTATRFLRDALDAEPFADLDPEEFYDFATSRPRVELDDQEQRRIIWPSNELAARQGLPTLDARTGRVGAVDVITIVGVEPQLKWRTYCEQIIDVAQRYDARLLVTLGALLAEIPHTRPVSVFGTAYDDTVIDELDLLPSRYEGPTGIVGVLHAACHDLGIPSASLWAAVPTYIATTTSPKAALALVEKAGELLSVEIETGELQIAARSYERQVNEVVADDEDTSAYVAQLEESFDSSDDGFDGPASLIDEVEQFLRDQD
jgi:hypothetical protein